jgi:hypothetical protein
MGWQRGYGEIRVHYVAAGGLPCFEPITRQLFDALPHDLPNVLYDPCTFIHITSLNAETRDDKSRAARFREIQDIRALHAEARAARKIRV